MRLNEIDEASGAPMKPRANGLGPHTECALSVHVRRRWGQGRARTQEVIENRIYRRYDHDDLGRNTEESCRRTGSGGSPPRGYQTRSTCLETGNIAYGARSEFRASIRTEGKNLPGDTVECVRRQPYRRVFEIESGEIRDLWVLAEEEEEGFGVEPDDENWLRAVKCSV